MSCRFPSINFFRSSGNENSHFGVLKGEYQFSTPIMIVLAGRRILVLLMLLVVSEAMDPHRVVERFMESLPRATRVPDNGKSSSASALIEQAAAFRS